MKVSVVEDVVCDECILEHRIRLRPVKMSTGPTQHGEIVQCRDCLMRRLSSLKRGSAK